MTLPEFLSEWNSPSPHITVHTSGSTGTPKPMKVEKERMRSSARITCQFLKLKPGDKALLCMSLDYIAGKMMVVRALEYGLELTVVPPSGHPLETVATPLDFAAMVPLQVMRCMENPIERERLRHIRHLIIGGGAIPAHLENQLHDFPHHVWSTYGMTETLSHIALRKLNGPQASPLYTPLDGVRLSLSPQSTLVIEAPHLSPVPLATNDVAELLPDGRFRILGRLDNVINSGSVKIQIEELEQTLRSLLPPEFHEDFLVTSQPDNLLGERVVFLSANPALTAYLSEKNIFDRLPRYRRPKKIISVETIPMTENHKPNRALAKEEAKAALGQDFKR